MEDSLYHRLLRISVVVCAVVLIFESGLVHQSTAVLSQNTHLYLANAVGMSASVAPTEINQMTAKLSQMEQELLAREQVLAEREIELGLNGVANNTQTSTYILATILFILLVLILLNYVLDFLRVRQELQERAV